MWRQPPGKVEQALAYVAAGFSLPPGGGPPVGQVEQASACVAAGFSLPRETSQAFQWGRL
ncbi:MAG: hypothetical protein ACRD2F_01395 [Terriglobales bacterium]